MNNPTPKTILAEVKRELATRRLYYPRWVREGKLTQAQADERIAVMVALRDMLEKQIPQQLELL